MKNNSLTAHIFFDLQNHPTFHSEERLVKRKRVLCWSISTNIICLRLQPLAAMDYYNGLVDYGEAVKVC